jgi:hypothetical protein
MTGFVLEGSIAITLLCNLAVTLQRTNMYVHSIGLIRTMPLIACHVPHRLSSCTTSTVPVMLTSLGMLRACSNHLKCIPDCVLRPSL